jgi:hypothetical protein
MRTFLLVVTLSGIAARAIVAQPLPNRGAAAERVPTKAPSTPASGDTVGYWQQRADYRVVVTLDEDQQLAHAAGRLKYVNASPDTLRELWLHQHLNAFRPGSRWSARDSAQGRAGYQALPEPEFAFERFTAAPRVGGVRVEAEYPLAPDSTVVRVPLPRPLAPRDSVIVLLAWDARPSTLPRRQGRKGRHYDFAQWFPKVAVYDRGGWQPNAFVRQGELYGEFGTFDVTFLLPRDQVIAATGVPVSGDPGWSRVLVPGSAAPRLARQAYGAVPAAPGVTLPAGYRAVRFVAKQVHHFGWSVSPDYRYEGATWVRPRAKPGGWDTVSLHVLHENWHPGTTRADMLHAMQWLEGLFGQYAWPQLTVAQRLDESGTEFPMLVMNGEEDRSLVVHEVGHQFTYGVLANNEWQSAWLDEGLTTYSEYLAAGVARVPLALEREARGWYDATAIPDSAVRRRVQTVNSFTADVERGKAPVGLRADLYATKDEYDAVVYDRAAGMYSSLHDLMGDTRFRELLRRYYARWAMRHVDRWAFQRVAEEVAGQPLGWFFDQWVDRTGVIDYRLDSLAVQPAVAGTDSTWVVTVQLQRVGVYRHPMPVGVQTDAGWTIVRGDPAKDRQTLTVVLRRPPQRVWLDPFGSVESRTPGVSHLLAPQR